MKVFLANRRSEYLIKYGYSEFGEVYVRKRGLGGRFVPRTAKVPEEVLNRETVNRLYTGGTQEQLSGLVHLDARHYSPAKTKFVQPDPYNLTELSLPKEARHTLVKATGLTLEGLLADPSQQLSNSYAGNNPLRWVDPLGLFLFEVASGVVGGAIVATQTYIETGSAKEALKAGVIGGVTTGVSASFKIAKASVGAVVGAVSSGSATFLGGGDTVDVLTSALAGGLGGAVGSFSTSSKITSFVVNTVNSIRGASIGFGVNAIQSGIARRRNSSKSISNKPNC